MITRLSTLFLRTLREAPADAELTSHQLLLRAGYVRRVAPGVYAWLPLGLKVLREVERVVREEMDGIGAQEISLPPLLPRAPYERSGRWTEYGPALFTLTDRKGGDYLLGPTHEEMFALTVKGELSSYKDFPVTLYQVQTKYRDEERPRAGILRGREFVMKDSYSFDLDEAGLAASYAAHRGAYQRIFDRLGLRYVVVAAMSGAMGGSVSEEFLAESDNGEDTYVRCAASGYAANVEAVTTVAPPEIPLDGRAPAVDHETGDTPTIATLVAWAVEQGLSVTAADTLKNVLVKTRLPGGEWELLGVGIPGDREVDLKRLGAAVHPAEVVMGTESDFARHPFLVKGYLGPRALLANGVRYLVDPRVVGGTSWVTGADAPGRHVTNLVCGRDFTPDGTIEAAEVRAGDASPDGGGVLEAARGIEIAHIFQLGRKYTDVFEVDVLGPEGTTVRPTMGSYGVGVSRLVGVLAEQHHDDKGLRWPAEVAPADVHLVLAGRAKGTDPELAAGAEQLATELDAAGLRVFFDDRAASAGVKFADAELVGVPLVVVVGRGWKDGVVELRERFGDGAGRDVPATDIVDTVRRLATQPDM